MKNLLGVCAIHLLAFVSVGCDASSPEHAVDGGNARGDSSSGDVNGARRCDPKADAGAAVVVDGIELYPYAAVPSGSCTSADSFCEILTFAACADGALGTRTTYFCACTMGAWFCNPKDKEVHPCEQ